MAFEMDRGTNQELYAMADVQVQPVKIMSRPPHRALELPEIIQSILVYAVAPPLDSPPTIPGTDNMYIHLGDKHATHWWIPLLVCKAWYHIGQDLILREISWNHEYDAILDQIPNQHRGLRRFVLHSPDSWFMRETHRAALNEKIDRLVARLGGGSYQTTVASSSSSNTAMDSPSTFGINSIETSGSTCTLRELSFQGDFTYANELSRFLNDKSIAQSLTLLELSYSGGNRYLDFDITSLFGSSSNPDSVGGDWCRALPHLQHLLIKRVHVTHVLSEWTPRQPSILKTLRMSRIKIDNSSLETLLAGLCGPCLEDLEVTMISLPPQEQLTYPTRPYLQHPLTLERIAKSSPRLYSVRLHQSLEMRAFEALQGICSYFPTVAQVALVSLKVGHRLEQVLEYQMTRNMTKLVISSSASVQTSQEIHHFLCSEQAQPLEELMLHDAPYAVNLVMPTPASGSASILHSNSVIVANYNNNVQSSTISSSIDPEQRIWKCNNLQMLTIRFESNSPEGTTAQVYDGDARSRQVFAFLVTHCPKLRYLDLTSPGFAMRPETGLCFLSRLQDLERLILRASTGFSCRVKSPPLASSSPSLQLIASLAGRGRTLSGNSANSHAGGSGKGSNHNSSCAAARWMVLDPTADEHALGQSSLKLCRRVAKLDGSRGHFGRRYGQGILWPATTAAHQDGSGGKSKNRSRSGSTAAILGQQLPQKQEDAIPLGACWQKLSMVMIEYSGFHGDSQLEVEHEARVLSYVMPNVKVVFTNKLKQQYVW